MLSHLTDTVVKSWVSRPVDVTWRVSSTGPAATAKARYMGVYYITNQKFNNFTVYMKTESGDGFLFVNNYGYWTINR